MEGVVSDGDVESFLLNGAICLRKVFSSYWLDKVETGIQKNLLQPSIFAESLRDTENDGVYFNDYCSWNRIPEFEEFVRKSPAAEIAGRLMSSSKSIFYHEHVLVKEPGAGKRTPWHMDQSYYPIDGNQCLSIWLPVDPVPLKSTLRFVRGSHRWLEWFAPRKFATSLDYVISTSQSSSTRQYFTIPSDEEIEKNEILEWSLEPGDCLVFHMKTIHGANGNLATVPRRVLSTRWLGMIMPIYIASASISR